jgi:hypothetical protein
MKPDVLQVLQQYKAEILKHHEDFLDFDWWHYLDDIAINAHDYENTGKVHVNLYAWFDDCGVVDMQESYEFTIQEFKNL